jgi:hypothetical protein
LALVISLVVGALFFLALWVKALGESSDGVTTTSGARTGLIIFATVIFLGLIIRSIRMWAPRWLAWVAVAITVIFTLVAGYLFATSKLDVAFAFYGGFQVLRAEMLFSDTYWVLSWFDCDFCDRWQVNYGPTVWLLDPLTFGQISAAWLMPIGIAMTLLAAASIWILARASTPLARWILVVAAISPAWLLAIDRANSDTLIFVACVIGLWFVSRHPGLLSWSLFALGLWILGTIKFFPFAIGLVLLFALGIRRGWLVIVGFAAATTAFMIVAWDSYQNSSQWTTRADLLMGDFPYYARIFVSDQLAGLLGESSSGLWVWTGLSILLFLGAVLGWGVNELPQSDHLRLFYGSAALAGGTAFAGKVLWAGFGFMYTGAFLLLIVPAFALSRSRQGSLRNGVAVTFALFTLIALFSAYNTTLATVCGLLVAGYGIGVGLNLIVRLLTSTQASSLSLSRN